jgi:hypothetical protein
MLPPPLAAAATCACLMLTATAAHARPSVDLASPYNSGRVTASGEPFDRTALNAAHRTLRLGAIVKVENRRNGQSVVVEINDRGPKKWPRRTIGLTREAARRIGMARRGVVPVRVEVSPLTRRQLDRAFLKLVQLTELRAAVEAEAAHPDMAAAPLPFQVAAIIATETMRPLATLGNIFRSYVESMIVPSGPHVLLTCADGRPLPEPLRLVLRRAALHFNSTVEVLSGFRSLVYNRSIYGNRCRRGRCRGDESQHIHCKAADIRIAGVSAGTLHAWALRQPELGGVGRYRGNFIHVDVRSRAHGRLITWGWRGKRKFARKHTKRYAKA